MADDLNFAIGILYGQKNGQAIIDFRWDKMQKQMPAEVAKTMGRFLMDAAEVALAEEVLIKYLTHMGWEVEKVAEVIGGFRQERDKRDNMVRMATAMGKQLHEVPAPELAENMRRAADKADAAVESSDNGSGKSGLVLPFGNPKA